MFRSLGDEITAVDVEGWPAWSLTATLEALPELDATPVVRLLPQFDVYVLGISRDCEPILAAEYKSRVYRPQGWISAVVLVAGRMEGVGDFLSKKVVLAWERRERRGTRNFSPVGAHNVLAITANELAKSLSVIVLMPHFLGRLSGTTAVTSQTNRDCCVNRCCG